MTIDLSFANSVPIIPAGNTQIQFVLVGADGTGSCIIRELCKVVCQIQSVTKKQVSIRIVDFDTVEEGNIPRQIFLPEEIGMNKAEALAIRYSSAFGISIKAIDKPFDCQMVARLKQWNTLIVIIGCVDNAAARAEIERKSARLSKHRFCWTTIERTHFLEFGSTRQQFVVAAATARLSHNKD